MILWKIATATSILQKKKKKLTNISVGSVQREREPNVFCPDKWSIHPSCSFLISLIQWEVRAGVLIESVTAAPEGNPPDKCLYLSPPQPHAHTALISFGPGRHALARGAAISIHSSYMLSLSLAHICAVLHRPAIKQTTTPCLCPKRERLSFRSFLNDSTWFYLLGLMNVNQFCACVYSPTNNKAL